MSTPTPSDQSRHFSTDHLRADLKGRSVRAGAVTITTQVSRFAINMAGMAVLARLLTPSDFGLIAMLYAITNFVDMFRDMGLSAATIQRAGITQDQVSTLFWLNVGFSAAVSTVIVLCAPLIAAYYGRPELTDVARIIGATFFLGGLNAQHTALLTRQMRFTSQALVTLVSMLLSTTAAIIAAYHGFGYWSLVIQQVSLALFGTIGIWSVSGWVPSRPRWNCGVAPMLKYGFSLAAFGFVNTFSRSLDSVLLGWKVGPASVGFYSRAYQLVLMPIQQINAPLTRVAMPALSRLQNAPDQYRNFYTRALGMTAFLGMPVVALLFVAAEPAIRLMLGPQWMDSVPLFRWLGPAAFFGTFNVGTGWVYASLGHMHRQLKWGLITSATTVTGFMIGLQFGAAGLAASFSIVYCCLTMGPPGFIYCFRGTSLRLRDAWEALWRPAATSLSAAAATWMITSHIHVPAQPALALLLYAVIYGVLYLAAWCALPDGYSHLTRTIGLVKSLKKSKQQATSRGFDVVTVDAKPPVAGEPSLAVVKS